MEKLGEMQISVDCDVLEADGGTRTASITGGFVALCIALAKMRADGRLAQPCIREHVAATSAGFVGDELFLDLVYVEDSKAEVDLNLVATRSGAIIEVQGTAEGAPVPRKDIDRLINTAAVGVHRLTELQILGGNAAGLYGVQF
jgi:ribonuclease PH